MKNTSDKKYNAQRLKNAYMIVYLIVGTVMIAGIVFLMVFKNMSFMDIVEEISVNLIGVFAGFIVFDIVMNKLTKEANDFETSQKIVESLTGDEDMLKLFTPKQREEFAVKSIRSLVEDEDVSDIAAGTVTRYLTLSDGLRIRKNFNYSFILEDLTSSQWGGIRVNADEHFLVRESLSYEVRYKTEKVRDWNSSDKLLIAFLFNNSDVDDKLRDRVCIFRENLNLTDELTKEVIERYASESKENIKELLGVDLFVFNGTRREKADLESAKVDESGIFLEYDSSLYVREQLEYGIDITFEMPMIWRSLISVILSDITFSPTITLNYASNMNVEMIPFINLEEECSTSNIHNPRQRCYSLDLKDKWLFPISGMVFKVDKKKDHAK